MNNKQKTIFLVDDDITNLKIGKRTLSNVYRVFVLDSGESMFELLENIQPDLILLDVNMPNMNGYEAIKILKSNEKTSAIPVIFLTALRDEEMELKGLSLGAIDYIAKPFSPPLLLKRIEVHLLVEAQKHELMRFNNNLAQMVDEKTKTVVTLKNAILSTMAELVEYRDEITGGHIARTQKYIEVLIDAITVEGFYAKEMSLFDKDLILQSSQLHDVGKIAISDTILNKPDKLTPEEFEIIKTHTIIGGNVIMRLKEKAMDSDFLEYASIIATTHHEKWDGSGYPYGLAGQDIPLLGRLMAVADVYDALVESRPYKKAFSHEKATGIIVEGKGSHFDPILIEVFEKNHRKFEKITIEVM
ncbi:MAG: response regulator [Defluviitaleaceae bacterium]|nr:response regulator [Defluviitaleaceae bacterium]